MEFTNREIASYLWLGGFLLVAFWKVDVRHAFVGVIKAAVHPKVVALLCSAAIYISLWVAGFWSIGIWSYSNLKTTILWAISFAILSIFETMEASRSGGEGRFFLRIARNIFGIAGILTFVAEMQSFSLPVELVVVPIVTVLSILHAFAEADPKFEIVRKTLFPILVVVGAWYFIYSVYVTFSDVPKFMSVDTLREFGIPILLSFAFFPFLYAFLLLVTYENAFVRLRWQIADEKLQRRAKWEAFFRFGPRLYLLRKWAANVARSRPQNVRELRLSFNETISSAKAEASPPFIKPSEGWSPYRAKDFLRNTGLAAGDYHRGLEEEWWANSPYLELSNEPTLANNLSYYIAGNERVVTSLKLCLNVNVPTKRREAERRFVEVGRVLLQAALGLPVAEPAILALSSMEARDLSIDMWTIHLGYEEWSGGIEGGFERVIEIRLV